MTNNYLPKVVHIDITNNCNLNCLHCRVLDNHQTSSLYNIDFETIKNTLTWTEIQSPYALPNDSLNKYIYLKITDSAGNIKISRLDPVKSWLEINWQSLVFIFSLIISLAVILLIMVKLKRRK